MTLRPGRPVVPAKRCNFERCPSTRAHDVNLTGKQPRALCDKHEEMVRLALEEHADSVFVTWGLSADEKRVRDQDRAAELVEQYGEPDWPETQSEPEFDWLKWYDDGMPEDIEDDDAPMLPSLEQEQAWDLIEGLRNRDYAGYYPTDDLPVVRIKVRTR